MGEAQKNKDRLKGRGSAAILKKEEAMTKQIKQIPKVREWAPVSERVGTSEWAAVSEHQ